MTTAGNDFHPQELGYELVASRGSVSIYCGEDCYLKVGSEELIRREAAIHWELLDCGFPVARILDEGKCAGLHYCIEESLGPTTFGDLFDADTAHYDIVRPQSFESFLRVVDSFAIAQITTASWSSNRDSFAELLGLDRVRVALPDVGDEIAFVFGEVMKRLQHYPGVVTHGDFHAFNVCERGVIDLETVTTGLAGYDLVSAILLPELFPATPEDYTFSQAQADRYLGRIDQHFEAAGLEPPSRYVNEFRFCKMIWLVAHRERPVELLEWLDSNLRALLKNFPASG
jgi:Phosphotransferase enzyme family